MNILIEINEEELKKLITNEIACRLGDIAFDPKDVRIEVKSAQNYKSEWEKAKFRAQLSIEA